MNLISVLIALILSAAAWAQAKAPIADAARTETVEKLSSLTAMREGLAATLDDSKEPITEATFKAVCAPVGKSLKEWAASKGYRARQVSAKFRNPANAPDDAEARALARFETIKPGQDAPLFEAGAMDGKPATLVFVPIRVTSSCLHCHGGKDSRPEFVKVKYPNDKAFGFKPGDLRGMYSVLMPKSEKQ